MQEQGRHERREHELADVRDRPEEWNRRHVRKEEQQRQRQTDQEEDEGEHADASQQRETSHENGDQRRDRLGEVPGGLGRRQCGRNERDGLRRTVVARNFELDRLARPAGAERECQTADSLRATAVDAEDPVPYAKARLRRRTAGIEQPDGLAPFTHSEEWFVGKAGRADDHRGGDRRDP